MIEVKSLFKKGILNNINLKINKGEIVVILGESGSGKTTLLNCLSGIDHKFKGNIYYDGKDISKYKNYKLKRFIKKNIGFVFQDYNLLKNLNAYENILVGKNDKDKALELLFLIGLTDCKNKYIYELSGGECQRISIARAIIKNPKVLICDEPTGALDKSNTLKILKILSDINSKYGTTIIIVTHNPMVTLIADRIIDIKNITK